MPINRRKEYLLVVSLCSAILLVIIATSLFRRNPAKVDRLENTEKRSQLTILTPPSIAGQMTELVTAYGLQNNIKISLNFIKESKVESTITEMSQPDYSIGLAGYELKDYSEEFALNFGHQKLLGVSHTYISEPKKSAQGGNITMKNLCQLSKEAEQNQTPIFISNSQSINNYIKELHKNDCGAICHNMQNRIIALQDLPILEFLRKNSKEYILITHKIMPDLLVNNEFSYAEYGGIAFYFHKDLLNEQKYLQNDDLYGVISLINENDLSIIIDEPMELEEMRNQLLDICQNQIHSAPFEPQEIDVSDFRTKNGILIGFKSEIEDLGVTIYNAPKKINLWFYCQDQNNKPCQNFQTFLSQKKAKSIQKKYL